jgi:predicted PurR-regulated permease PerM
VPIGSRCPAWQRAVILLAGTAVAVVVVGTLYWAQSIFIPVALATYLTFLLVPLVRALEQLRLGRVFSVLLAVLFSALVLGSIGWIVSREVAGFVQELPQYTGRFKAKIEAIRSSGQGPMWKAVEKAAQDMSGALDAKPEAGQDAAQNPQPVAVQPETHPWLARLPSFLSSLAESLGGFALTIFLLLFMLLKREDLRSRVIWLIGYGRVTVTTKALDDAGQRLSRYLLMQAVVNGVFGLSLGIGLWFIGLDYAFLWGFLAAVLRYIPYVGTWVAALLPITLSLGMFDGWLQPMLVIGLFLTIELICSNVVEPRGFGKSMGVSEVALLVAAAFWAFLWGPIGLVLSNPLTVCLVVLGKYVPQLEFFDVLLGDEPVLDADLVLYQRLLARDQDEAAQLVQARLKDSSLECVYDELLIPVLMRIKQERARDELSAEDERFIVRAIGETIEDLGARQATATPDGAAGAPATPSAPPRARVLGCPGEDQTDHLALEMFRQLLDPGKWEMQICGVELLTSEIADLADTDNPSVICIASIPPGGLTHCRYLCKRLRNRISSGRIVVGRWGLQSKIDQNREQLLEAGADQIQFSLVKTREALSAWLPVFAHEQTHSAATTGNNDTAARKSNSDSGTSIAVECSGSSL